MKTKLLREVRQRFTCCKDSKYSIRVIDKQNGECVSFWAFLGKSPVKYMLTQMGFTDKYRFFFVRRRFRKAARKLKSAIVMNYEQGDF